MSDGVLACATIARVCPMPTVYYKINYKWHEMVDIRSTKCLNSINEPKSTPAAQEKMCVFNASVWFGYTLPYFCDDDRCRWCFVELVLHDVRCIFPSLCAQAGCICYMVCQFYRYTEWFYIRWRIIVICLRFLLALEQQLNEQTKRYEFKLQPAVPATPEVATTMDSMHAHNNIVLQWNM